MPRRKFTIKNIFTHSKPRVVRRTVNEKLHFEACEPRKLMAADTADSVAVSPSPSTTEVVPAIANVVSVDDEAVVARYGNSDIATSSSTGQMSSAVDGLTYWNGEVPHDATVSRASNGIQNKLLFYQSSSSNAMAGVGLAKNISFDAEDIHRLVDDDNDGLSEGLLIKPELYQSFTDSLPLYNATGDSFEYVYEDGTRAYMSGDIKQLNGKPLDTGITTISELHQGLQDYLVENSEPLAIIASVDRFPEVTHWWESPQPSKLSVSNSRHNETWTYSLTNIPVSGNTDGHPFYIFSDELFFTGGDYEEQQTHSVHIQAVSNLGRMVEKRFTFHITDVDEAPTAMHVTPIVTELPQDVDTSEAIKLADIDFDDDALGSPVAFISSLYHESKFEIRDSALYLKAGVIFDRDDVSFQVLIDGNDPYLNSFGNLGHNLIATYTLSIRKAGFDPTNLSPTSVSFLSSITEIAEEADTTARTLIGELTVADDGLGTNTLSLSGTDANSFELDGTTLYLKAGVQLSHTTQATYNVTISATDDTIQDFTPVTLDYTLAVSEVEVPVTPTPPTGGIVVSDDIDDQTVEDGSTDVINIDLDARFDLTGVTGTVVKFETNAPLTDNDFYVELTSDGSTDETNANFLSYVNSDAYDNFHFPSICS